MIKFFRKIRQQLLAENKFTKYFLYAIGEIALVVIGILIALQINNWNENNKSRIKELSFLEGIRNDLVIDTVEINKLMRGCQRRLSTYMLIDSKFSIDPEFSIAPDKKIKIDTTTFRFRGLFNRVRSFKSTKGSFDAMISDGESQLITNKDLFNELQSLYLDGVPSMESNYEDLKHDELSLKSKWTKILREIPYTNYNQITDKNLLADLFNLHRKIRWYCGRCQFHNSRINEVILQIDEELEVKRK